MPQQAREAAVPERTRVLSVRLSITGHGREPASAVSAQAGAKLGSAGLSWEPGTPSILPSIPHRGQTVRHRHLHAPPAPASAENLRGWMGPLLPSGLAFPRARGFLGGSCGSPALWEQGPRQPRLSMQQGGRSVTHSPLSGADHFKSRWCLKRGIRKNNPHKSGRERGQDGKRQHPSTSSISSCRAGDGANRGRPCAIGVA